MGYYPVYMPDSYLHSMRSIPIRTVNIPKVELIEKKKIENYLQQRVHLEQRMKEWQGKGKYVDMYA